MPELLTVSGAAQFLKVSESYLNKLRLTGGGPSFSKLGTKVIYNLEDLSAWVEARKHRSTSEYPGTAAS